MNIGLSNFAFEKYDDLLNILPKYNINNIELVYTKYYDWDKCTSENNMIIKKYFGELNLNIYSIQSIFYNTNITSFNQIDDVKKHFQKLLFICKDLDIKKIIFGSPSFRLNGVNVKKNMLHVLNFIEEELRDTGIKFIIEPNSRIYKTEFFYDPYEIFEIIIENDYKNISTMIDTHNYISENYDPISIFEDYSHMIDHIHISEYTLSSLKNREFHERFSEILKNKKYNGMIVFEIMKNFNIKNNIIEFSEIYY